MPSALDHLLRQMMAKRPGERPATAARVANKLEAIAMPEWDRCSVESWWARFAGAAGGHDDAGVPTR